MQRQMDGAARAGRRAFLATSGAITAGTIVAVTSLLGARRVVLGDTPRRKFRRYNLTDSQAKPHLKSYEAAITQMLQLPPEHPLNWYRMALIHLMDCPHGNWWFLPWQCNLA